MEKLESAASTGAMQGERRTVTMLFCDVQGSTTAAEHMDPEEWAEVMNGAFEHLIAPVYRYEGTLARLMGDAILAFFGAPIAHEDDPERAVLAGLEILDAIPSYCEEVSRRWGVELDVRVGINTGLVVVGAIGSDLRVEYTAMGDAVNVAARMEQTAAPGTVQISEATRRLVDRLFEFEPLGAIDVKGRSESVEAHRVLRALPRPATTRGILGLRAPMIGRGEELDELRKAIDEVSAGYGRIVSVMGEAGLGKSRLVSELRQALEQVDSSLVWVEGRSLSYETAVPFAPAQRLLSELVGVDSEADPETLWRAVESTTRRLLPGRWAEVAPFIGAVTGAALPQDLQARVAYLDPAKLRSEAFRSVSELLRELAARSPIVAVLEDLHWADSASVDLVTALLDVAEQAPIGLVMVFRPRRNEPSWAVHETAERDHPHIYSTIALEPLETGEARTLVSSLLDVDALPEAVRERILSKSDGNPFFLEEVIRSMIDQGLVFERDGEWVASSEMADVSVPDTLVAVITTRLDRLVEAHRAVAHAASVLGREFRYDELAAVMQDVGGIDDALVVLQRRDILREVARVPKRVFRFKHMLVQETVYETVLLRHRHEMHASIAAFLERVQPERVEDIADHYLAARLPEQALPHLAAAGTRALRAFALPEATDRFERALAIIDSGAQPESTVIRAVLEGLGRAREMRFDFPGAAEAYARLRDEGERLGELPMSLSGRNKAALVSGVMFDDRGTALGELEATEVAAKAAADDESLAEAYMYQCFIRSAKAEFDRVEHYMGELTRIGEKINDTDTLLFGMVHLANTLMLSTKADLAIEKGVEALAKAEELGQLKFQAELLTVALPFAYLQKGDQDQALRCVERGMEIALQIGDYASESYAAIVQGKVAMNQGHFDDALALFRRAERAAQSTGMPPYITLGKCVTGTCYAHIGGPMLEQADALHTETLDLAQQPLGDQMGAWVWAEVGHCALTAGDVDKAEELFTMAIEQPTVPTYISRPDALRGLVDVALTRGRLDEAQELLRTYGEYVREREMANCLAPLLLTEARVAAAMGDHEGALLALDECLPLVKADGSRRIEIDLHACRARSLDALGDTEGARQAMMEVERIASEIASGLRDDMIRSSFGQAVLDMVDPVKG